MLTMTVARVVALILALTAPLSLAACGEDDDREVENGQVENGDDDDNEDEDEDDD
jgi:hypothetical protein